MLVDVAKKITSSNMAMPDSEHRGQLARRFVRQKPKDIDKRMMIHVGIPTMGTQVGLGVMNLLNACDLANDAEGSPFFFTHEIVNNKTPIEYARNIICRTFLEDTEAEKLFMIDSDILPPENVFNLFTVDADIVVGQSYTYEHQRGIRDSRMKLCAFQYNKGQYNFSSIWPGKNRYHECDAVGTGAIVIHRRVLSDPRMHLPGEYVGLDDALTNISRETMFEDWAPALFRTVYKPNGQRLRGEDIDFTWRAKNLGYRVIADVNVVFGHLKKIDLKDTIGLVDRVVRNVSKDLAKEYRDAEEGQMENQGQSAA